MRLVRRLACVVLGLGVLSTNFVYATPLEWEDQVSGRQYLLLDQEVTWVQALKECNSRGYALFDLRFVSNEELTALVNSQFIQSLTWRTYYEGTAQELRTATIWQSNEYAIEAGNADYAVGAVSVASKSGKLSYAREMKSSHGTFASALCHSVPGFWYRCSATVRCNYPGPQNNVFIKHRIADYGASDAEALGRIGQRLQEYPFAGSEGECALLTETSICQRLIPN